MKTIGRHLSATSIVALLICLLLSRAYGDSNAASSHWALLIGINRYSAGINGLSYAANDARRLYETLTSPEVDYCRPDHAVLMTTEAGAETDLWPSRDNILREIEQLGRNAGPTGTVMVYYAGHGIPSGTGDGDLVPADAVSVEGDLTKSCIPMKAFCDRVRACCPRGRRIIILDCCNSGAARSVATPQYQLPAVDRQTVILTACGPGEEANEIKSVNAGAFSYLLNLALKGFAKIEPDGSVTAGDIIKYIKVHIADLERNNDVSIQTPELKPLSATSMVLTHPQIVAGRPDIDWHSLSMVASQPLGPLVSLQISTSTHTVSGGARTDDPIVSGEIRSSLKPYGLVITDPDSYGPEAEFSLQIEGESSARVAAGSLVTVQASITATLRDALGATVDSETKAGDPCSDAQESAATQRAYGSALDNLLKDLGPLLRGLSEPIILVDFAEQRTLLDNSTATSDFTETDLKRLLVSKGYLIVDAGAAEQLQDLAPSEAGLAAKKFGARYLLRGLVTMNQAPPDDYTGLTSVQSSATLELIDATGAILFSQTYGPGGPGPQSRSGLTEVGAAAVSATDIAGRMANDIAPVLEGLLHSP